MYEWTAAQMLKLLKVPPPPQDPFGEEQSTRIFRASPNYFRYRFYLWLLRLAFTFLGMLVILIIDGVVLQKILAEGNAFGAILSIVISVIVVGGFACHALLSYVMMRLDYEMRWYKVTDRSLLIREGVMSVREMTMTFANIQNIAVSHRAFR